MHCINLSMFYPLENILQIKVEHVAMLPFRFIKYTKDNIASKGDIKSIRTRFLEPRLPPVFSTDENIPFNCVTLFLILGNWFLITDMIWHSVALWNLRIHAGIPIKLMVLTLPLSHIYVMWHLPYMAMIWLRAMAHCPKLAWEHATMCSQAPNLL